MEINQILVKLLDGKTKPIQFTTPTITGDSLKHHLSILTKIPSHLQLLTAGGHVITDETLIHHSTTTIHLLLRLRGGKGGFGSLLRGAATKAGQKKTNNFDACRDMSGRRLRHVNAEKKLEEWRAEAEGRELERIAEEFMKKKAKASKGSKGSGKTEKYIQKYREDSAKCVEEVEASVRESIGMYSNLTKKKKLNGAATESEAKRLKIWMGKKKVEESDSDEDENDAEKRIVTSIVLDEGNHLDGCKTTEGSSALVANGKLGEFSGGGSPDHSSVKEKEVIVHQTLNSVNVEESNVVEPALEIHEDSKVQSMPISCLEREAAVSVSGVACDGTENPYETVSENLEELVEQTSSTSSLGNGGDLESGAIDAEENKFSECKSVVGEEIVVAKTGGEDIGKPLNFDKFNSAAEMEALGMERLKCELQTRGLKCGGTLQERAARLFLLKTTPLEKLPKKLLAKK